MIGLALAGRFDLLRNLFGTITVVDAVRNEVQVGGHLPGAVELEEAILSGWAVEVPAAADAEVFPDLGAGEACSLALANRHDGPRLVVLDERLGRSHAHALGVPVVGVAGVLLAAKRAGLLDQLAGTLDTLARGGFRLSAALIRAVLAQAGER